MLRVSDEDERDSIYQKYFPMIGDLVRGTVKESLGADILVGIDSGVNAILPRAQQSNVERWLKREQIRAVITNVTRDVQHPQEVIELSRRSSMFLQRLFEQEVTEIFDGKVVIKAAARAQDGRSKIAVMSTHPDVNAVDACLGTGGSHIKGISRELRGEKIDVIEWSDEPTVLAVRALTPARIIEVRVIDAEDRVMEAIVSEDQLEIANGKRGENLRAASELLGWRIHLIPENENSST